MTMGHRVRLNIREYRGIREADDAQLEKALRQIEAWVRREWKAFIAEQKSRPAGGRGRKPQFDFDDIHDTMRDELDPVFADMGITVHWDYEGDYNSRHLVVTSRTVDIRNPSGYYFFDHDLIQGGRVVGYLHEKYYDNGRYELILEY
jgi:hypothetical protein